MKRLKISAIILSLVILTACKSGQPVQTSETVSDSETSAITTSATTAATTETESETVPEAEPDEIAEENEIEYVKVSIGNKFIDFEFIENYQGTTDIGDLADKAVEFLKTTDEYAESMKNISEFSDREFSDYIADGVIVPKLKTAYPNDYDGDGREETFIILKMPSIAHEKSIVRDFIIFADSGENMEIIDHTLYIDLVSFLNYGKDKQIIFGGHGDFGAEELTELYGVKHGDAVMHYGGRVSFYKSDCFLSAFDWQGCGDFMYYDTAMQEYRSIMGEVLTIDEMKAIDKESFFAEYYEAAENGEFAAFLLIGGKYYCLVQYPIMDVGTIYTCEDGKFTLLENSHVRISLNEDGLPMVKDIDISKAIAEMEPPSEPFVEVSEGNEFIDYDFIENYQGTTDIGDLADKAVEFLKTTDFYADSMKNIAEFSDEDFSDYIEDGVIVPKFNIAYPNDYDGDGRTETFIMVDMPYFWGEFRPVIRNILIFADSDGVMEVIGDYSYFKPERYLVLLNYGKQKQIIFGGDGTCGADMHVSLYGVKNGKSVRHYDGRCGYKKDNCFLKVNGYYGDNCFMYFDTAENEYRGIVGVPVSIDEMKAIDSESFFAEYYSLFEEEGFVYFELVSKNYYRVYRDLWTPAAVYKYENGKFTKIQDSGISNAVRNVSAKAVIDIDIDKAIAEMKKPQK